MVRMWRGPIPPNELVRQFGIERRKEVVIRARTAAGMPRVAPVKHAKATSNEQPHLYDFRRVPTFRTPAGARAIVGVAAEIHRSLPALDRVPIMWRHCDVDADKL